MTFMPTAVRADEIVPDRAGSYAPACRDRAGMPACRSRHGTPVRHGQSLASTEDHSCRVQIVPAKQPGMIYFNEINGLRSCRRACYLKVGRSCSGTISPPAVRVMRKGEVMARLEPRRSKTGAVLQEEAGR